MAPYIGLAAFTYPTADDFDFAVNMRLEGYWSAYYNQFVGWSGRFASNLIALANPMATGSVTFYRAVVAILLVLPLPAIYVFIRAVAVGAFDRRTSVLCALGWFGVFLVGQPALGETGYWYTGAVIYALSCVLLLLQAAAFVRACSDAEARFAGAAAVALIAIVVGMNEIAMLIAVAGYATLTAIAVRRGERRLLVLSLRCLVAATLAAAVVLLSPGHAIRTALYPARHQLAHAAAMTLVQTLRFAAAWATGGALLIATFLFLPLAHRIAARAPSWRRLTTVEVGLLVVAPFALIPLSIFPPYWATGILGQHRTVTVAYAAFLTLWFLAAIALAPRGVIPRELAAVPQPIAAGLAVALVVGVAFTGNGYDVATDLVNGRARAFSRAMAARSETLEQCRTAPAVPCVIASMA